MDPAPTPQLDDNGKPLEQEDEWDQPRVPLREHDWDLSSEFAEEHYLYPEEEPDLSPGEENQRERPSPLPAEEHSSHGLLSHDLVSHGLVRQALLAGNYAVPRLPEIPVEKILDHAEYWKWVKCSTDKCTWYPFGWLEYLRLSVPPPEVCMKVKKVEITCFSHYDCFDWTALDRPCTWGNVSILVTNREGVKELRRQERVFPIVCAINEWELHRCSFDEDSELVSSLDPGSSEIVFYLCADFPLWDNYAKRASIKIMFV